MIPEHSRLVHVLSALALHRQCSSACDEYFLPRVKPGRHGPDTPRYIRLALAPAPLRERAGRLARDTVARCGGCRGCVRDREARIVRSRPPSVKPAARLDRTGPSAGRSSSTDHHGGKRHTSGGAGAIRSERLEPGAPTTPRPALPAGQGPAASGSRLPLPLSTTHCESMS